MFSIHSISFGLKDASTHYQCALEYERAARKWTVLEIEEITLSSKSDFILPHIVVAENPHRDGSPSS